MADKYIEQAPNGELVSPDGSEVWPLAKGGTQDFWMAVGNFLLQPRYVITPTVAANNLSVTLKNLDGSAPSSSRPLKFRVGDTQYSLTSDPTFTKAAGTNWCNLGSAELAGQNVDLFYYAIGETGASAGLKFGFSRIPYATTMGDFVNTTTNEKYIAGNWTNFNATDAVVNIGRFRVQLSAAAGHNWSIPSAKVINRPIFETDWLSWTPAIVPGSGSFTTLGTITGRYKVFGQETILVEEAINITTNGTAATYVRSTLPFSITDISKATGRSDAIGGKTLTSVALTSGTLLAILNYDNTYPGASGEVLNISGTLRIR